MDPIHEVKGILQDLSVSQAALNASVEQLDNHVAEVGSDVKNMQKHGRTMQEQLQRLEGAFAGIETSLVDLSTRVRALEEWRNSQAS
jgi:predicted nuclease with TOPRIM domain